MKITKEIVEKIASIAHITLSEEEKKRFEKDLGSIIDSFKILDEVPDIDPTFHPINIKNVVRDDVPEKSFSQDKALGNTKHSENGFFKGPRAV